MFSYSGWFAFHMEPAGYVKMFVFVLLGYAIVTIFDFRRIRKIPMDEALKSAESAADTVRSPAGKNSVRTNAAAFARAFFCCIAAEAAAKKLYIFALASALPLAYHRALELYPFVRKGEKIYADSDQAAASGHAQRPDLE